MKKPPIGQHIKKLTSSSSRLMSSSNRATSLKNSQKALSEVEDLCKNKLYKDALIRIEEIEIKYPSCSKALAYFRGLAQYEMAKEEGSLPKLSHMRD